MITIGAESVRANVIWTDGELGDGTALTIGIQMTKWLEKTTYPAFYHATPRKPISGFYKVNDNSYASGGDWLFTGLFVPDLHQP